MIYAAIPESDKKEDSWTDWYYNRIEEFEQENNGEMNKFAWRQLDSEVGELPPEAQQEIEERARSLPWTPTVEKYYENMAAMKPYWDLVEQIITTDILYYGYVYYTENFGTTAAAKYKKDNPAFSYRYDMLTDARKALRELNRQIDSNHVYWFGSKPKHILNIMEEQRATAPQTPSPSQDLRRLVAP
jgi:hypothetical protein